MDILVQVLNDQKLTYYCHKYAWKLHFLFKFKWTVGSYNISKEIIRFQIIKKNNQKCLYIYLKRVINEYLCRYLNFSY